MLMLPPSFLRQEDTAVECLSASFQFFGGACGLIGGFSASSLAVRCLATNKQHCDMLLRLLFMT
jgi:hypothetical protein